MLLSAAAAGAGRRRGSRGYEPEAAWLWSQAGAALRRRGDAGGGARPVHRAPAAGLGDRNQRGDAAACARQPPLLRRIVVGAAEQGRSEEHTSELQSLMRISYAVFCLKKKKSTTRQKR